MKPKPSPLKILDIAITQFDFSFIPSKDQDEALNYFDSYELDIDFIIHGNEHLMVQLKADVNRIENPLPGYSFLAEVTCIFSLDKNLVNSKEMKDSLGGYSTLYITLNALRSLISNFTSNAPWGRYILPSIDLNDLIEKKKILLNKMQSENKSERTNISKVKPTKKRITRKS